MSAMEDREPRATTVGPPDARTAEASPAASSTASDHAADDGLDVEQQRAVEAIMAEIEADHRMDDQAVVPGDTGDGPQARLDGSDTPAGADAAADDDAGEPSSEDGLDDEQQQAFEAIMAEIEAGGNADDHEAATVGQHPDAQTDTATGSTGASDDADDHSAATDALSEELDEDQQRAFANIMAQIQGQEGDPAASPAEPGDGSPSPDNPVETGAAESEAHNEKNTDAEPSGDMPDEIEKILADIAVEQSPSDAAAVPADTFGLNADHHAAKHPTDGADMSVHAGTADDPGPEEPPPSVDGSGLRATGDPDRPSDAATTADSGQRQPSATPVGNPPTPSLHAKKRLRTVIATTAVAAVLIGTGYLYVSHRTIDPPVSTSVAVDAPAAETIAEATVPQGTPRDTAPPSPDRTSDRERLKAVIAALNALRDQLIDKQSDVDALRTYYHAGIDAEMQTIATTLANAGPPLPSMDQALADPRIELGLAAIQRRDTTLRKLVEPLKVLHHAGEEVLFWSRKGEFLSLMAAKTSDIDINGYITQVNRVMDRHQRVLGELNIDSIQESPLGMEVFWRRIIARLPKQAAADRSDSSGGEDAAIARRICSGDFTDKHRLTTLSPEVARCLAQWEGKDLFLNGLVELTPEAARHLVQWNGDWLGLNGLTTLSPETAAHLARWTGRGLSLNGLARLSPRVVAILSEWQGEQIELINVQHMAHWENPNVRLFLSENLKRHRPIARN